MGPSDTIKPGSSSAEDPWGFWDLLFLFVVLQVCLGCRNREGQQQSAADEQRLGQSQGLCLGREGFWVFDGECQQ